MVLATVACGDDGSSATADTDDTVDASPEPTAEPDEVGTFPVGATCSSSPQCVAGSECFSVSGTSVCTKIGCSSPEDCNVEGNTGLVCTFDPRVSSGKCAPGCDPDAADPGCTGDNACITNLAVSACLPPFEPLPMDVPIDPVEPPVDVPASVFCAPADGPTTLTFDIPAGTTSYIVVPFTLDGSPLVSGALTLPGGLTEPIGGTLFGIGSALIGFTNPILVPAFPDAPIQPTPGIHELTVSAVTDNLCLFVVTEDTPGTELLLNIYTIGVPLTADDPLLEIALETVEQVYEPADISVSVQQVVALDAPEFEVITAVDQVDNVVALTEAPTDTLSLNVVITSDFDVPETGTIGVSSGIPGPAGLHGSGGSGVVLSGEFLELGTATDPTAGAFVTGLILAHEMGHFMGLFHTTESDQATQDPIADTPNCTDDSIEFGPDCPDFTNNMFPSASLGAVNLTAGQASVLAANPLTAIP